MDLIYVNLRHDDHRIHIEISDSEISDLLDDIGVLAPSSDEFQATKDLRKILIRAHDKFVAARAADAYEATL